MASLKDLTKQIGEMLRKTIDQCGDNWDLEIPFAQFHYMNHDHSATGYSPFYLSYDYHPRTPQLVLALTATTLAWHLELSLWSTFWSCHS